MESTLYQTRNQSPKDKIAFPIQLNDRLAMLCTFLVYGNGAPTRAQREVFRELQQELVLALSAYEAVRQDELERLNAALAASGRAKIGEQHGAGHSR